MERYVELFKRIVREEEGQDLVEYVLILGFIALATYLTIELVGEQVATIWNNVLTAVTAAADAMQQAAP